MKITFKVDEKKRNATFMAQGVRLHNFASPLALVHKPKPAQDQRRYTASFHIDKNAEGVADFIEMVKKLYMLENSLDATDEDDVLKAKVNFFEKTFVVDGDAKRKNKENGEVKEPYKDDIGTFILNAYRNEFTNKGTLMSLADVFAKKAYQGQEIPAGWRLVGGKSLVKKLSGDELQGSDIVNIQGSIYCAQGRVCCGFEAVQFVKKGLRTRGGGADYDSFAGFEDSEELDGMDFSDLEPATASDDDVGF